MILWKRAAWAAFGLFLFNIIPMSAWAAAYESILGDLDKSWHPHKGESATSYYTMNIGVSKPSFYIQFPALFGQLFIANRKGVHGIVGTIGFPRSQFPIAEEHVGFTLRSNNFTNIRAYSGGELAFTSEGGPISFIFYIDISLYPGGRLTSGTNPLNGLKIIFSIMQSGRLVLSMFLAVKDAASAAFRAVLSALNRKYPWAIDTMERIAVKTARTNVKKATGSPVVLCQTVLDPSLLPVS